MISSTGTSTRRDGPTSPSRRANSSSAAARPICDGMLGDDGQARPHDVGQGHVVEAHERDVVLGAEIVQRAHRPDRHEVLGA